MTGRETEIDIETARQRDIERNSDMKIDRERERKRER